MHTYAHLLDYSSTIVRSFFDMYSKHFSFVVHKQWLRAQNNVSFVLWTLRNYVIIIIIIPSIWSKNGYSFDKTTARS